MSIDQRTQASSAKTFLVTGGATGIGVALVTHFAAQGARVHFIDIDDAGAEAPVVASSGTVSYAHCDVRYVAVLRAAIARFEETADWSAPIGSPELMLVHNRPWRQERRRGGVRVLAERLDVDIRPGLDVTVAAAILDAVSLAEVYAELVEVQGRTSDAYET